MKLLATICFVLVASVQSFTPRQCTNGLRDFRGGDNSRNLASTVATATASNILEQSAKDVKKSMTVWSFKDMVYAALAVLAIATSSTAMVIEASIIVTITGFLCMTLGMSSLVLQKKLSEVETMRQLTNQMRQQVNSLSATNSKLKKENIRLDVSTQKLQKAEADLASISATQGVSIDVLVKQVSEYKLIQQQVKEDLKSKIKQTLLSVVLRSDIDQDYQIDPEEIDMVVLRLNSLPNVKFNEANFRKAIKKDNGSLVTFMNEHLTDDMKMVKDKIFVF